MTVKWLSNLVSKFYRNCDNSLNIEFFFQKGIKHSIDYSNELSANTFTQLVKELKDFSAQMNETMPEIQAKSVKLQSSFKETINLTEIHLGLKKSINDINIQVYLRCGSVYML